MKKRIIVADINKDLERVVKTYCNPSKITVGFYSKSVEILPLVEIEDPSLVFLSLDLPDISDFVVFDILKRCTGEGTPEIYIIYSEKSEEALTNILKMKFKASGYMKKPLDNIEIADIIQRSFDSNHYLIPTDITMKEILDDEDILDLGSIEDKVSNPEMDTNDIIFNSIPEDAEHHDPGTREDMKLENHERIEAGPMDEDVPEPDDLPFQISDDEVLREVEEMKKELEEKEIQFLEEKRRLLRDIKTSELKLKEKDAEKTDLEKKMNKLQEDYEVRISKLNDKYKDKLKKFQDFLKDSLADIDEN